MSKVKDLNIAIACHAIVGGMFATFTNPKNCGVNFTWDDFPNMMGRHCDAQIFLYIPPGNKSEEMRVRAVAMQLGKEIATNLIGRMK